MDIILCHVIFLSQARKNIIIDNYLDKNKSNSFHDRFIILDKEILYHYGASFKDLGKKCFAITKMEDEEILRQLIMFKIVIYLEHCGNSIWY